MTLIHWYRYTYIGFATPFIGLIDISGGLSAVFSDTNASLRKTRIIEVMGFNTVINLDGVGVLLRIMSGW